MGNSNPSCEWGHIYTPRQRVQAEIELLKETRTTEEIAASAQVTEDEARYYLEEVEEDGVVVYRGQRWELTEDRVNREVTKPGEEEIRQCAHCGSPIAPDEPRLYRRWGAHLGESSSYNTISVGDECICKDCVPDRYGVDWSRDALPPSTTDVPATELLRKRRETEKENREKQFDT